MSTVLQWLQSAVERFRGFAYGQPGQAPLQRRRVGLALGGGFARGIAHIGVLKVFQEHGIPIDYLAGTSVGALVAAAYASGVPLEQMEQQAAATNFKDFGRWTLSWMGLATNERLERYLRRFSPVTSFEELKIPLAIAATDLRTGEAVYFTKGPLGPALRASCAYPGLFLPVEYQGHTLVDGFLVAPVPVEAVRSMGADVVIGVYLESGTDLPLKSVTDVIGRSFSIIQRYAQKNWRERSDLVIEPAVKSFLWDNFEKSAELIAAGEAAARAALPRIQAALAPPVQLAAAQSQAYS
jgi:NTE family protein